MIVLVRRKDDNAVLRAVRSNAKCLAAALKDSNNPNYMTTLSTHLGYDIEKIGRHEKAYAHLGTILRSDCTYYYCTVSASDDATKWGGKPRRLW